MSPETVYAVRFYRKLYAALHPVQSGNPKNGWRSVIWTKDVVYAEKFSDKEGAAAWADDMAFEPGSFTIVPVMPSFPGVDDPGGGTPAQISAFA